MNYLQKKLKLGRLAEEIERDHKLETQREARSGETPVRHKCFVCYHGADIDQVIKFVEAFRTVFIPRVVGVSDSDAFDDPIDSTKTEYIKQQISEKYLFDSTVTIAMIGSCTWARKFVDWELSATLRNDSSNKRMGLMAIDLVGTASLAPERLDDNLGINAYARRYNSPSDDVALQTWIEDAFQARTGRAGLIDNTRTLRQQNTNC